MVNDANPQPAYAVAPEEFPLGPYMDTLFRWAEDQPWYGLEVKAAWQGFLPPGTKAAPQDPVSSEPDWHDRILRFRTWFLLDRNLSTAHQRPVDLFLENQGKNLTGGGRAVYEGLCHSLVGAFRVQQHFRTMSLEQMGKGQRYALHPGVLTDELQVGDLVVGRLYPFEGQYVADPDVHIGHLHEVSQDAGVQWTAPFIEQRFFNQLVPAKGAVLDVLDALLVQVDSPLTAEDVLEMVRQAQSLEAFVNELFSVPAYKLRYLHLRDRSLLDELLQEVWDAAGPLQDAQLTPEDATALARIVREALRAIADGDVAGISALADPKGFVPLYLDLFGVKGLQRLAGVANGSLDTAIRTRHQMLPRDGGIFTTLSWGKEHDRHCAGMVSFGSPNGQWRVADVSPPEQAGPALMMAYDRAQNLGWGDRPPRDEVELLLRGAVDEIGYSVHDTIDLFRLWREFAEAAKPDLSQPGIWAAGVELADSRYRNENLDVKVLAKSYGVMPRAIEQAADAIDTQLRALSER